MILAHCELTITLRGPVITKATALGGFGIDAAMAQSAGSYYLPGTLIKGRLREAWQELSAADPAGCAWPADDWLGKQKGNREQTADGFEAQRARIYFGDLKDSVMVQARNAGARYRIRLDADRGSVESGALLVIEAPYASGSSIPFGGRTWFLASDQAELDRMRRAVEAGLRWVSCFGAERSIGFGQLEKVELSAPVQVPYATVAQQAETKRFDISLALSEPFAVSTGRPGQNLFESGDCVPGAAIRGAIGELLNRGLMSSFRELSANLHLVRVTHAFPALDSGTRPLRRPLSLFTVGGRVYDAAMLPEAPANFREPPAFAIDWKSTDEAAGDQLVPWPDLSDAKELRVRTKIDGEKRKAEDEKLFAVRAIVPGHRKWKASVDLSRITDAALRTIVARQLAGIFVAGLPGIGKTKTFASVSYEGVGEPGLRPRLTGGETYIVCLQTDTLLLAPEADAASQWRMKPHLKAAYQAAFGGMCEGALVLENLFQRTKLAGGDYLYHMFRGGQNYRPYLLTEAGSVFQFQALDAVKAKSYLTDWLRHGLPIPIACRNFYLPPGTTDLNSWRHCPYLPENGYGEIAVNLDVHDKPELVWNVAAGGAGV